MAGYTTHIKNIDDLLKDYVNGKIIEQKVQPLVAAGENNGGELLKVQVTIEENGTRKVLDAVAKLIPPTEEKRNEFHIQSTFKKEIGFYAEIVPLLKAFQKEHGISEVTDYYPKLYGARINLKPDSDVVDEDAVILLENLKIAGYENIDRRQGFDLETTKLILQVLANLQATVIGIRLKKPDVFNDIIKPKITKLRPPMPKDGKDHPKFNLADSPLMKPLGATLKENLKTAPLMPRVNKFLEKGPNNVIREPWVTITHNDLWVNNIMLKEKIKDFNDIKLVDFQMLGHGSPAVDLTFFLFSSVQTSVLKYHFDKLILYFYNSLIENLQKLDVDVKQFDYESFQEEVKNVAGDQIFHAIIMLMNVIFGEKDEGPKSNKSLNLPLGCKEKIWFIIEEANERNWF